MQEAQDFDEVQVVKKVDLSKAKEKHHRQSVISGRSSPVREENPRVDQGDLRLNSTRRKSRLDGADNPFDIPLELIPKGYSVEWKRLSTHGQEDPFYMVELQQQGWVPASVDMGNLKALMPKGYTGKTIERQGQILMIRPMSMTEEARKEDLEIARNQVKEKMEQLGLTQEGQAPRTVQTLNRTFERIPVDEK